MDFYLSSNLCKISDLNTYIPKDKQQAACIQPLCSKWIAHNVTSVKQNELKIKILLKNKTYHA